MRRSTMMQAQFKVDTQQGENLHFENCKGGYFSTIDDYGLKVIGKTYQKTLTGKNLLKFPYVDSSITRSGITYSVNSDGTVIVNGTAIADSYFTLCETEQSPIFDTSLYISGCPNGSESTFYIYSVSTGHKIYNSMGFPSSQSGKLRLRIIIKQGYTANNLTFKPQCELNGVTSYEPYCGGVTAPNPEYPVDIQCVKQGTRIICEYSTAVVPCDLYEGDIWYPMTGKVVRKNTAVTLNGTETFTQYSRGFGVNITNAVFPTSTVAQPDIFSNLFIGKPWNSIAPSKVTSGSGICMNAAIGCIAIVIDEIHSVPELLQWLTNNPVTVLYRLATPIAEQYDPQPIFAPHGTVNVLSAPTDLTPDIKATMLVRR